MADIEEMKPNSCEAKLSDLLTNVDVYAADHVLWLDHRNEVHLSAIPEKETIQSWKHLNRDRIKYALKPFLKGEGLVGPEAGQDREWLEALCAILSDETGERGETVH